MIQSLCPHSGITLELDDELAKPEAQALLHELEAPALEAGAEALPTWNVCAPEGRAERRRKVVDPLRDPRPLFEAGGGKMFGVLIGESDSGARRVLRAFSGMYGGSWVIGDWVPPCFDAQAWYELEATFDPSIAELSAAIKLATPGSSTRAELIAERGRQSKALMARYHELYRLRNRGGTVATLAEALRGEAPSSGMGDCCAPKLLTEAQRQGLRPVSLAEIFVGKSRNGAREHGHFYPPCKSKCGPILPFLLSPPTPEHP